MGSFGNFVLSADPGARYDSASVKRHRMPVYGPLRMSKNTARGSSDRHTYNMPPDRFATTMKRSTPVHRAMSDPPPGQMAREVRKRMTVPLSLRDAWTVRQRKVSDTYPS
jgi:hypothetical protein